MVRRIVQMAVEPTPLMVVDDERVFFNHRHAAVDLDQNLPEYWERVEQWLVPHNIELPIMAELAICLPFKPNVTERVLVETLRDFLTKVGGERLEGGGRRET